MPILLQKLWYFHVFGPPFSSADQTYGGILRRLVERVVVCSKGLRAEAQCPQAGRTRDRMCL